MYYQLLPPIKDIININLYINRFHKTFKSSTLIFIYKCRDRQLQTNITNVIGKIVQRSVKGKRHLIN